MDREGHGDRCNEHCKSPRRQRLALIAAMAWAWLALAPPTRAQVSPAVATAG